MLRRILLVWRSAMSPNTGCADVVQYDSTDAAAVHAAICMCHAGLSSAESAPAAS